MRPLSVLFTSNALGQRGGSETYTRDVALALLRRGHRPVAFSLVLGDSAAALRAATVPVLDDLTRLGEPPDVIHGHHHLETLIAALAFPGIPIVNFCHGWVPWEEMPLHHPAVRHYVAVDEVCVDRLVREEGIAPERVELLLNFVDLDRFRPRPALPPRPARAIVLSNGATMRGYARVVAAACEAAGISLDVVGGAAGNAAASPEALLPGYDLVFAKGRTALEALAVGCATVVADVAGAGPLVTPDNYPSLRARNFGIRELRRGHDPDWYATQIAQYDAAAAAEVSARVRAEAAMEPAIDRLLDIYASAIAAPQGPGDASRAAAIHVSRIARAFKEASELSARLEAAAQDLAVGRAEADAVRVQVEAFAAEVSRLDRKLGLKDHELELAREEVADLRGQLDTFRSLPTLKLRDAVLRTPVIGSLLQSSARGVVKLLRR